MSRDTLKTNISSITIYFDPKIFHCSNNLLRYLYFQIFPFFSRDDCSSFCPFSEVIYFGISLSKDSCSFSAFSGVFYISFVFTPVLIFRGTVSFEPTSLPSIKHLVDSFAIELLFCCIGTSILVRTFAANICDSVTFFESINASSN